MLEIILLVWGGLELSKGFLLIMHNLNVLNSDVISKI